MFLLLATLAAASDVTSTEPTTIPTETPQPRQACAARLVATSATLAAGGLALLGGAIAQADQGRAWEPFAFGGAVATGGGLAILVNLAPLVRGRPPSTPQGC